MSLVKRIQLSAMMFLQYFIWGIWLPVLGIHLESRGVQLTPVQTGIIFSVYGFGAILGPFILGQLADRYFATERVMFGAHLIGGLLLIATAYASGFWPIFILLFLYCNLYMPTMGLSNSLTFRTAGEGNQDLFPAIRVFGTFGWIGAGWLYAAYRSSSEIAAFQPLFDIVGQPATRDALRIAGVVSILYAFYCLTLPHTPPIPAKETDPIDKKSATLEAFELMRNRSFAIVTIVSALIGIELAFYFACEGLFLVDIGVPEERVSLYMSIGQIAEIVVMFLVPWAVNNLGIKRTMIIGAAAWAVRFGISMLMEPQWLMVSTIALHGFAFGFFFVVAQMYVDRAASEDIKATAQNFLIFLIYGIGTIVGSVMTGFVRDYFGKNWTGIWAGPTVLTVLCILAFALLFREQKISKSVGETEPVTV